jgi:hypothetical protein
MLGVEGKKMMPGGRTLPLSCHGLRDRGTLSLVGALKGRYLKERLFSLLCWYCTAHVPSDGTLPSRNTKAFTGLEFVTVSWLLLLGIDCRDLGLWS